MPKGPKGFSDTEKEELKTKLCLECEHSWSIHGYKKTSISELTAKIGISTGAFYLLYPSKEDLFCETIERLQSRLKSRLMEIINVNSGKEGFINAMKWHFKEYSKAPFLYDFNTPDFLSFMNKLPKKRVESLRFDSESFFYDIIALANLTLKVTKEKAYAITNTLLYTVALKDQLKCNQYDVFTFLLHCAVDELFE